jgi:hypothetical protein
MNLLNIGMKMSDIKLPVVNVGAVYDAIEDDSQINPSSIMSYLGVRGVGRNYPSQTMDIYRKFNAIPLLAYYDIFKNYYANKQETNAYVIHTDTPQPTGARIDSFMITVEFTNYVQQDLVINTFSPTNASQNFNATIYLSLGAGWQGQKPQLDFDYKFILASGVLYSLNQLWLNISVFYTTTTIRLECKDYVLPIANRPTIFNKITPGQTILYTKNSFKNNQPKLTAFPLEDIDKMRKFLLRSVDDPNAVQINNANLKPYNLILNLYLGNFPLKFSQEGLVVKTYQSDLFNNWIQTEWITGPNGIANVTAIDTYDGYFYLDTLNLSSKVYAMLNQIAISGGSYDDWLDAVYTHQRPKAPENPIYHGSLIKELSFEEVVSNSESNIDNNFKPLGTLAGRGRLTQKHKGGKVIIKTNEPSYIMGIVSLTPRVDYSQGNSWDMNLKTLDDLHKPALDAIAYQDLITDQLLWSDTVIEDITGIQYPRYKSLGKQPAWLNYMTNVNKCYGSFAIKDNAMWMTLNRRYERNADGSLKDGSTYIDPIKFNQIFAETALDAQNFWIQISNNITCRRKMSAKQIPNL